jgi:hypothetical protein
LFGRLAAKKVCVGLRLSAVNLALFFLFTAPGKSATLVSSKI